MGATWQPMTGPRGTTPFAQMNDMCHDMIFTPANPINMPLVPARHPMTIIPATSSCAMCHPCSGATCHDLNRPHLHLPTLVPTHPATLFIRPYNLYSQLPHHHCTNCTINILFCLFDETNRSRYISHAVSV
jgi:hypothetical protein